MEDSVQSALGGAGVENFAARIAQTDETEIAAADEGLAEAVDVEES